MAAHQFNAVAWTIQSFSQEPQQGLVGGGIYRGRCDFDSQFVAQCFADFIRRSARLQFYGKQNAIRLDAQERWNAHPWPEDFSARTVLLFMRAG